MKSTKTPPGSGSSNDAFLEYIELYGTPGMDLTGYCIGQFKGGEDNDDNIPEVPAEIDEAFSLDGLSIGTNGFLVIYNGTVAQSLIPIFLPNEGEHSASFFDTHIPSVDTNGNLNNDGSSTYLLIRKRPFHSIVGGVSVYEPDTRSARMLILMLILTASSISESRFQPQARVIRSV